MNWATMSDEQLEEHITRECPKAAARVARLLDLDDPVLSGIRLGVLLAAINRLIARCPVQDFQRLVSLIEAVAYTKLRLSVQTMDSDQEEEG